MGKETNSPLTSTSSSLWFLPFLPFIGKDKTQSYKVLAKQMNLSSFLPFPFNSSYSLLLKEGKSFAVLLKGGDFRKQSRSTAGKCLFFPLPHQPRQTHVHLFFKAHLKRSSNLSETVGVLYFLIKKHRDGRFVTITAEIKPNNTTW